MKNVEYVLYNARLRKFLTEENTVDRLYNSKRFDSREKAERFAEGLPMHKEWIAKPLTIEGNLAS